MKKSFIVMTAVLSSLGCSAGRSDEVDLSPIAKFDLGRYLGRWYEIARLDHGFERNMSHTTANYTMLDNGLVKVENSGLRNGKWHTAIGKAKIGEPKEPGYLRVSFFWIFYAPYRVIILDPEYRYAVVASSKNFLWILSRTPTLAQSVMQDLINELDRRGFETDKLIYPQQQE